MSMGVPTTAKDLLLLYAKEPCTYSSLKEKESVPRNYFSKRHLLFSRFDEGIQLTPEMWYSVCAECFAHTIAKVLSSHIQGRGYVLDLFGGAGGQAIGFALEGHSVHSLEYSEKHCALIHNNAQVYGVSHLVFPVCCDVFTQALRFCTSGVISQKYDCVVLSPPWGGPGYWRSGDLDFYKLKINKYKGSQLVSLMCRLVDSGISKRFILHLPRNTTTQSICSIGTQIARHISRAKVQEIGNAQTNFSMSSVVVSEMQLNGRVSFLVVYIGCWNKQLIKNVDNQAVLFTPSDDHSSKVPCGHFV
ncbi:PRIP-interacting protein PIPMT [Giardia lamblia P15]|uniref:Trimethylguanosine synthase n=1 Tax=Giardia intestinalis (strain P15) TaxID=658858 RepID=E1EY32_GIAIA|nr:PRIP-interacting protein PIPMT [Giardia lamblia P15]